MNPKLKPINHKQAMNNINVNINVLNNNKPLGSTILSKKTAQLEKNQKSQKLLSKTVQKFEKNQKNQIKSQGINKQGINSDKNNKAMLIENNQKVGLMKKTSLGGNSNNYKNSNPMTQAVSARSQVKTPMRMQRTSTKKIQLYDSSFYQDQEDDFNAQLQYDKQGKYFQCQLQKNIKVQQTLPTNGTLNGTGNMKKTPQNKALIVLPKLQGDVKVKQVKDLQKQMDLQMSRLMMDKDQQLGGYN